MQDGDGFVDLYAVLQVSRTSDRKTLEAAYRRLAKMYHPDHAEDADSAKLTELLSAYKTLRDPKRRAEYDAAYGERFAEEPNPYAGRTQAYDSDALNDADDQAKILMFLYKKRREDSQNAGVVGFYLQELLNCSYEEFEFHKWYLKEKGFVAVTEQGTLAITIQGVDHIISTARTERAAKLLIGQSREEQ